MKRPVTIRGIAALAGVSPAAVSYVLSGKSRSKRIPETTERRIIDLAESLGWMPNHVLSSFATGKTKLVGLWQTSLREPYHTWVTQATEQILREAGYAMILSSAHVKEPGMEYDLSLFNQWSVDGLFGLGGIKWISRFFEINPHWRLPMVSFGNHVLRDNPNVDSVYVDVLKPVRTGLEAWFEQGYRRIAMLSGHDSTNDVYEREQVYMSFVHRHRLKPELISFPKQESQRKSAETTLRRHILQHGCPQALFCRSDEVMIGASKTLQELGYRIHGDVELMGIDGIQDIHYLGHPVTTVVQPVEQMCRVGWKLLRERLAQPDLPPRHKVLDGTLNRFG